MNFDLTEEQRLLVSTVASFTKKHSPVGRLRAMREDPTGWSRDVLRQMAEYGWLGVSLPEEVGGLGGTFVDAALILEELGTTLVPEPVLSSLVAAAPILSLGTAEQKARWVTPFAEGAAVLALAWAEAQGRHDVADVTTRAERSPDGYRLSGSKRFVLDGHAADHLVVSARTSGGGPGGGHPHTPGRDADGVSLFVVDPGTAGVSIQPVKTMDGHRAAMITFHDAPVGEDRLLGPAGGAAAALEDAMDLGAAGACAEGVGITRTVLAMTTDYLRTREQFGVKIGSFQALQHRAVDMFVETQLCKSMAILAALRLSDPDEATRKSAVSAAKVQLAVGGRYVTQQSIQLHGGIGVTDEHDVGLYFKRMTVLNALFGDEEHHVARYARLPSFTAGLDAA